MAWDPVWDEVFKGREWGKYPPEEVVRFVARNFYRAPDRRAVRLLEVGCGTGANLWFAAREGFSVYGIDGSTAALETAKARFSAEGLPGEFIRGDAAALPYPDGFFDGALDIACLYSNAEDDARRIIAEVRRVLKPGGFFFSRTFMAGSLGLPADRGVVRLMEEDGISGLYAGFSSLEYDSLARTDGNRAMAIKEWLITCRK
ncbi:MAG: class I SAM-dependent methyltransferase [Elusimicrobia bacterium]|nr:class I SAM-dependent methyltransferase [Elusimicrobiota bacterium]